MRRVMQFPEAIRRDPAVDAWIEGHSDELGSVARRWFEAMRACGADVRELLHDGHPTACVGTAAFGYVNAFKTHVNVGFFNGTEITDPGGVLEGAGKFMRHVKVGPGREVDAGALGRLIVASYADMKTHLASVESRAREENEGSAV